VDWIQDSPPINGDRLAYLYQYIVFPIKSNIFPSDSCSENTQRIAEALKRDAP